MKTSRALSELFFLLCDSIQRILDDLHGEYGCVADDTI